MNALVCLRCAYLYPVPHGVPRKPMTKRSQAGLISRHLMEDLLDLTLWLNSASQKPAFIQLQEKTCTSHLPEYVSAVKLRLRQPLENVT